MNEIELLDRKKNIQQIMEAESFAVAVEPNHPSLKNVEIEVQISFQEPIYTILKDMDDLSQAEWMLTIESFLKFQLRRGGDTKAGVEPFKKNILKVYNRQNFSSSNAAESLYKDSINFVEFTLQASSEYNIQTSELRNLVLTNARTVLGIILKSEVQNVQTL